MNILKIKYLDSSIPKIKLPRDGDLGIDLFSANDVFIDPYKTSLIDCGIKVEIPKGYAAIIKDRSSLSEYIHIMAGVIDSAYLGPWKVRAFCHKPMEYTIEEENRKDYCFIKQQVGFKITKGMKIGQFILVQDLNNLFCIEEVEELNKKTDRGENGFGSTGV